MPTISRRVRLSRTKIVWFVASFAVIAALILVASRAAGPIAAFEPEQGSVQSPATVASNSQASGGATVKFGPASTAAPGTIDTIYVLPLENRNWADITGGSKAEWPYLNNQLLTGNAVSGQGLNVAWATNFNTGLHPSLPNYVSMESGSPEGLSGNGDAQPNNYPINSDHLTKQMTAASIPWKTYEENLPGGGSQCFLSDAGTLAYKPYSEDHNPFVYFTDVQGNNSYCMAHVRPIQELCADLGYGAQASQSPQWTAPCTTTSTVNSSKTASAKYTFIGGNDWSQGEHLSTDPTAGPNGHAGPALPSNPLYPGNGQGCGACQSDFYLSQMIPIITNAPAFKNGNSLLIVDFDEGDEGSNAPSGMVFVSKFAKAHYSNSTAYSGWPSYVRTIEDVFGLPHLSSVGANTPNLSDLLGSGI